MNYSCCHFEKKNHTTGIIYILNAVSIRDFTIVFFLIIGFKSFELLSRRFHHFTYQNFHLKYFFRNIVFNPIPIGSAGPLNFWVAPRGREDHN